MKQGQIWLVNLDPSIGAEIKKTRPCLIVNDDTIGALPLKIVAPLTDAKGRFNKVPWMVVLAPDLQNGLTKPSAIDLFQVRCVAEERLVRKLGQISTSNQESVKSALKIVFSI
jgi:mRNA interferase MazF